MSAFDICFIVLLSVVFCAVVAKLIYNKVKGKGGCSDCTECSGCHGCSSCSHCSASKTPEDKNN